jgi:NTP pyrophosphatase (non-canonical NTP hydrolase)
MGYMTDGLTLNALRGANLARLPQFKDARGRPAHSEPDGSDWALSAWSNAVLGELGEAANIIKKIERGDFPLEQVREILGKELADVLTYLDILAYRVGVDLGRATIEKFNEVSVRVGSTVRLAADDWHYEAPAIEDAGQ